MNKIEEILKSYAAMINPTPEQEQVAKIRLKTCMGCEFWSENALGIEYCKLCGCATRSKVYSPKGLQACPENKWEV